MPELPEVEVIKHGLQQHLPGRKVLEVVAGNKKLRLPMPKKKLKEFIQGARIRSVDRRAKFLLITMNNGAVLIVHLGMTGRLGVFPDDAPKIKHDHLRLQLENYTQLRFNDIRRFGSIQVIPPGENLENTMLSHIGPEPFAEEYSAFYLHKLAADKNRPVKNFLMDSRVVAGIGNIYACEILFHAGLRPTKKIKSLSMNEWRKVVTGTHHVLKKAIASGGTTINDFVNERGKGGYFQLELQTYGRQGKSCKSCECIISRITMAGRSTFFCPECQK